MRRGPGLLVLIATSACAYYNGLYNARGLAKRAESASREGRDSAAIAAWREAAAKADTVIARYPRSRWTDDALLLSGTSSAFAGHCLRGLQRLEQWEKHTGADTRDHARASIARGACLVRLGEPARGLDTLAALASHRDQGLSRIAAAWAARAALAINRPDSAIALARVAGSDALDGELARQALVAGDVARATRILRQRAREWRSLPLMHAALEQLATANRGSADSIVQITQSGRASRVERARLSVVAASWAERSGDEQSARRHYDRALRMSADTALVTDVVTRLALLDVRAAVTVAEARARLERSRGKAAGTGQLAQVDTMLRLAARLASASDSTGASVFLAGEVARDAIGAPLLARALFLQVTREHPTSSLAPKALLAAASLTPDSAAVWRAKVLSRYPASPYARVLDGKPMNSDSMEADERVLRQAWARATAVGDSANIAAQRRVP
ncbi:MAG TPA: hypothetical protein VH638_07655 [Gemmatimonadaceae bacterium]